jgi:hypothetical protein
MMVAPFLFVTVVLLMLTTSPVFAATINCFTDVSTSDWFHDFVCWMLDNGLTSGYPDGSFRPNNPISRAEVSVFIQNVHRLSRWGQAWFGSGTGLTLISTNTTGITNGLLANSASTDGTGVVGHASSLTGDAWGVFGQSDSNAGIGVLGWTPAASGNTYGVFGQSDSSGGNGVRGHATSPSGATEGVYGQSDSSTGIGVKGRTTSIIGITNGVYGQSDSVSGSGVLGWATAASGFTNGVYGQSDSSDGAGVFGSVSHASGVNQGVLGKSASSNGAGVYGWSTATSGTTYGVYGKSDSPTGYGGYFEGDLAATGIKTAIVETNDYGWRHLYAVESPGNWFEDFGTAQLDAGQVTVNLEPIFDQTVNTAQPYHVFVTPLGDCSLFVSEKGTESFTVKAMGGLQCNIQFDYRIVAKRLGYEDLRLGPAEIPGSGLDEIRLSQRISTGLVRT